MPYVSNAMKLWNWRFSGPWKSAEPRRQHAQLRRAVGQQARLRLVVGDVERLDAVDAQLVEALQALEHFAGV